MATITVKVPEDLREGLRSAARRRGTTCSRLMREAAREIVGRERRRRGRTVHEMIGDLCGIASRAPRDLATDPSHMEGFGR